MIIEGVPTQQNFTPAEWADARLAEIRAAAERRRAAREAELCRHGVRPGECPYCVPRQESIKGIKSMDIPMGPPGEPPPARRRYVPPSGPQPLTADGMKMAVYRAACEFDRPFTLADLTINAWAYDWKAFGLDGFQLKHPDPQRVRNCLYGARGLLARRLIRRVAGGRFEAVKTGEGG